MLHLVGINGISCRLVWFGFGDCFVVDDICKQYAETRQRRGAKTKREAMNAKDNANESKPLNIGHVTPAILWEIAEKIVEKQKECYLQDPKKVNEVLWHMMDEEWFDYLEEKLSSKKVKTKVAFQKRMEQVIKDL